MYQTIFFSKTAASFSENSEKLEKLTNINDLDVKSVMFLLTTYDSNHIVPNHQTNIKIYNFPTFLFVILTKILFEVKKNKF